MSEHDETQWGWWEKQGKLQRPAPQNSRSTFIFILIALVSQNFNLRPVIPLTFAFNAELNNVDPHALLMDQYSLQISDL